MNVFHAKPQKPLSTVEFTTTSSGKPTLFNVLQSFYDLPFVIIVVILCYGQVAFSHLRLFSLRQLLPPSPWGTGGKIPTQASRISFLCVCKSLGTPGQMACFLYEISRGHASAWFKVTLLSSVAVHVQSEMDVSPWTAVQHTATYSTQQSAGYYRQ